MRNEQLKAIRELSNEELKAEMEFYGKEHRKIPKTLKEVRISSAKRLRAYTKEVVARTKSNQMCCSKLWLYSCWGDA